jgi:Putative PepSY_TM-like
MYELTETRMGFFAILDLLKGRDTGKARGWMIDLSAVLTLVSLAGLLPIFSSRRNACPGSPRKIARQRRRANITLTCPRKPVPLVARSPDRAYVESNSYRSLPLNAGTPSRFEPRRPPSIFRGPEPLRFCSHFEPALPKILECYRSVSASCTRHLGCISCYLHGCACRQ